MNAPTLAKRQGAMRETPQTDAFRSWLQNSLTALAITPTTLAREIDAGVNSIATFLRNRNRDITLGRAAEIERHLRRTAKERGIDLPVIGRALTVSRGV